MKYALYSLLGLVVILALSFGLRYFGLVQFRFFEPKMENARREVFEETQSYVEGIRQQAIKYRLEYMTCNDSLTKQAIKMTCVQAFSNFDEEKHSDKLSPEIKQFIKDMKYN